MMNNLSTALLPGRYDPTHRGHWLLVYDALERFNQVIVGIRDTQDDLFSGEDRLRIATKAFTGIERCIVTIIPDIDQCQTWSDLIKFDAVLGGNDRARQAVGQYYQVMDIPRHGDYSATEVRRRLSLGLDISDLVVPGTAGLIWQFWERQNGNGSA